MKLLECVRQHQILRFGVDRGSLPRPREPRPADLDAVICGIVVSEARASHRAARGSLDRDEGKSRSLTPQVERRFHVAAHLLWGPNHDGSEAPDLRIESDLREPRVVLDRHRLESYKASFEDNRLEARAFARHSARRGNGWRRSGRSQRDNRMLQMESCRLLIRARDRQQFWLLEQSTEEGDRNRSAIVAKAVRNDHGGMSGKIRGD